MHGYFIVPGSRCPALVIHRFTQKSLVAYVYLVSCLPLLPLQENIIHMVCIMYVANACVSNYNSSSLVDLQQPINRLSNITITRLQHHPPHFIVGIREHRLECIHACVELPLSFNLLFLKCTFR